MSDACNDTLADFLGDTFALLVEAAREASTTTSTDPLDQALASGRVVAYHDAITRVQPQLIAFGLEARFPAIIAFDATGELLVSRGGHHGH